ncbi:protein kinase domain-containing protein [Dokdonella sp.]|uniref:protein kinase domain-containing protein n=1 Tax=Dokdonella sp. TaxID=2291710 RepID=UPI0037832977
MTKENAERGRRRVRDLFEEAVALPPAARGDWLEANVDDAGTRAEVERLIAADDLPDTRVLDHSVDDLVARVGEPDEEAAPAAGDTVGSFSLGDMLGEGGSSLVYRASREQDGVRQHVALKLLRRGLQTADERRRFRDERRALAQLRHPGIAHLIEGGYSDAGVPYIALELVDGVPITDHARARELDLRARLRLFVDACRAVETAHRALIVHRDLKPSNVLVTRDGVVKLLDFGIAKLLDADDDPQGQHTQHHAMTPAYAAPEQFARGAITTATDVYALGVLLGELICGQRRAPGDTHPPSARVSGEPGPGALPAPPALTRRLLRGDLDNIVLKATATEPELRYASAGALADDIERHLAGQPVLAHPPSARYRARKFVARHRAGVAMSAAVCVAVLLSLGIAVWQARIAREQARLAHHQSMRANATRDFMVELLKTASADLPKDERPSPQQLVDQAARDVREDPDMDPFVRAQVLLTLGSIARSDGDYANAGRLIDEAMQRERELGVPPESPDWLAVATEKGNLLHSTGRSDEADRLMADLVPAMLASDTEPALSGLMLYGATRAYAGDTERAATIAQQALTKAQRVFGADSVNGIATATYLGQLCSSIGRYHEAETILDEAIARWRRLGRPQDQQFARSLLHLAVARQQLGKRAEVEPLFREGIALMRRIYDGPHDRLAMGLVRYGTFLTEAERFDDAQAAIDEALAAYRKLLGDDDAKTATALDAAGELARARNAPAQAEPLLRTAYATLQARAHDAGYGLELAAARLHLADTLLDLGRTDEAAALAAIGIEDAPPLQREPLSPEAQRIGGRIALARAQPQPALDAADRALAQLGRRDPPPPLAQTRIRELRTQALLALGRTGDAVAEANRALASLHAAVPEAHLREAGLLALRARCERADGRADAATASIAQARALGVPAALLAERDRALLETTAP